MNRNTNTERGYFRDLAELRARNKEIEVGGFWFSPDTMRWFDSRIESDLLHGSYFVSSEQEPQWPDGSPRAARRYTVRMATKDATVRTVGDFQAYETREEALAAISELEQNS